jgi:GNAT superfamily N-acetyltransferase
MEIAYLGEHPSYVPVLAQWLHAEFAHYVPGATVEHFASGLRERLSGQGIPTAVIALARDVPIGTASLVRYDMAERPQLSPWLADVYVTPAFRRQGVGSAVVQRIIAEARALDVETLYLYTADQQSFYARLGWSLRERLYHVDTEVDVMVLSLQPGPGVDPR